MNPYLDLYLTFARIGVCTFGGGYAMLPILQREVVENRHWATEDELMDYYAIGQCTPGVIAVNTSTFIGYKTHGILGGIAATAYTTSPIVLTDAIESLLRPLAKLHFPVHELAMMMTIALRFIPTLIEETEKIMNAQKARGAMLDSGTFTQRIKALVPILIPLFISAFRRADELAMAMECRCYHGGEGRTRLKQLKFTSEDFRCMVVIIVALVVIACTRFFVPGLA